MGGAMRKWVEPCEMGGSRRKWRRERREKSIVTLNAYVLLGVLNRGYYSNLPPIAPPIYLARFRKMTKNSKSQ